MDPIHAYADAVSNASPVWLLILLALNLLFTAVHVLEEWKGAAVPLWRVFGAILGVAVPDRLGFALFTLALPVVLWIVGIAGLAGWSVIGWFPLPPPRGVAFLGAIVGALASDSLFSHWIPFLTGYRPNPGVRSTVLYALEAAALAAVFWKGFSAWPFEAALGGLVGALAFLAVWGGLVVLRLLAPSLRRPAWVGGQPIPEWARG